MSFVGDLSTAIQGLLPGLVVDAHAASGTFVDHRSGEGTATGAEAITTDAERPSVLEFDTAGDRFDLADRVSAVAPLSQGTIHARFKCPAQVSAAQAIAGVSDASANTFLWLGVLGSTPGIVRYGVRQAGTDLVVWQSTNRYDDGAWHDIQVVVSSSGTAVYIDGNASAGSFTQGSASSSDFFDDMTGLDTFEVGRLVYTSQIESANLLVDRVRVWSRPLSSDELADARIRSVVVVLIGQSNTIGRAGPINSTLDTADRHVKQLIRSAGSDDQTIGVAAHPLDHDGATADTVGLGIDLGNRIRAHIRSIDNGALSVVLVPAAKGGTGFTTDSWSSGDPEYNDALNRINAALGFGGVLGLIAWHQGETDAGDATEAATHAAEFPAMVVALRAAINDDALGGHSERPFVAGELGGFLDALTYAGKDAVQAQINEVSGWVASAVASSESLTDMGDGLHFNADSQRRFAGRYFDAWLSLAQSSLTAQQVADAVDAGQLAQDAAAARTASAAIEAKLPDNDRKIAGAGTTASDLDDVIAGSDLAIAATVNDPAATTTAFTLNITGLGSAANVVGAVLQFTSGQLAGHRTRLTAHNPATGAVEVVDLPAAPANGDNAQILGLVST
ncbi:MAG: sialate O-acetylesterase [Planctomycetota bacterium]